ncbi:CAP domain-containing protein [Aestuariivirga sp.]|uniref:CAP domain-containing protein n=1 Tax=Aestuariivirga sp. TaxID=2650926 RepID=UPI00391CA5AF
MCRIWLRGVRLAPVVAAVWFLLVAAAPPAAAGPYLDYAQSLAAAPPAGSRFRPDLEEKLAELASAYRLGEGKEALTPDPAFQIAARAHAADMMINGFIGHKASTGQGFQSRMAAFVGDVTKYPSLGENAARDTQDTPVDAAKAEALFQQWVNSRTHRKVMVNRSFRHVSTGVIQRGNEIWAVQIFFGAPRKKGLFQ